jgi:hypothetical protein
MKATVEVLGISSTERDPWGFPCMKVRMLHDREWSGQTNYLSACWLDTIAPKFMNDARVGLRQATPAEVEKYKRWVTRLVGCRFPVELCMPRDMRFVPGLDYTGDLRRALVAQKAVQS